MCIGVVGIVDLLRYKKEIKKELLGCRLLFMYVKVTFHDDIVLLNEFKIDLKVSASTVANLSA